MTRNEDRIAKNDQAGEEDSLLNVNYKTTSGTDLNMNLDML